MIEIRFDSRVRTIGMLPQIALAIPVAIAVFDSCGIPMIWIRSVNDGRHSRKSLHYAGAAFDIATNVYDVDDTDWHQVGEVLREALPTEFDVVVESHHIHVEYQPKQSANS